MTLDVTVWHVLEHGPDKIQSEASFGQFHSGDTYVVKWQYKITTEGNREIQRKSERKSRRDMIFKNPLTIRNAFLLDLFVC